MFLLIITPTSFDLSSWPSSWSSWVFRCARLMFQLISKQLTYD